MEEYTAVMEGHESGYCYSADILQKILREKGYKDAVVTDKTVKTERPIDAATISFLFDQRSISLLPQKQ